MTNNKQYIKWEQIDKIVDDRFKVLNGCENAHIITLFRGGLPLSTMISNRYKIPLSILDYQSYDGTSENVTMIKDSGIKENDIIYLIDDIADTGNSIKKALDFLNDKYPSCTVIVYTIVGKSTNPSTWKYDIEFINWVVFPWEENNKVECKKCIFGEPCNKEMFKTHCNIKNESFYNTYSCIQGKNNE